MRWIVLIFSPIIINMILTSSLRVHTSGKLACRALDQRLRLSSTHLSLSESDKDTNGIDSNNSEEDLNGNSFISSTSNNISPEGFLPTDFSSLGDAKQSRVLLYIALALLPCLALIPFFMSRDFVPPIDAEYSITSSDSKTVGK